MGGWQLWTTSSYRSEGGFSWSSPSGPAISCTDWMPSHHSLGIERIAWARLATFLVRSASPFTKIHSRLLMSASRWRRLSGGNGCDILRTCPVRIAKPVGEASCRSTRWRRSNVASARPSGGSLRSKSEACPHPFLQVKVHQNQIGLDEIVDCYFLRFENIVATR